MSWCTKRQPTVALSSTEAEYIALTLVAKEATCLRLLLTELGLLQPDDQHGLMKIAENNTCTQAIQQDLDNACGGGEDSSITIPLKGDHQGSIALAQNPVFHYQTKHIANTIPFVTRDAKRIELSYVKIKQMIADGLTKALTPVNFHQFVHQMRMI